MEVKKGVFFSKIRVSFVKIEFKKKNSEIWDNLSLLEVFSSFNINLA